MNKNILIIEDEAIVALDIKTKLEEIGYNVLPIMANVSSGMDLIKKYNIDLVLIDYNIKGKMGALEIARKICFEYQIPHIYITGNSSFRRINQCLSTRPSGFLCKPFAEQDLYSAVEMAFSNIRINNNTLSKNPLHNCKLFKKEPIIISFDTKGKVFSFNQKALHFLNYQQDEFCQLKYTDIFPLGQPESFARYYRHFYKKKNFFFYSSIFNSQQKQTNIVGIAQRIYHKNETLYQIISYASNAENHTYGIIPNRQLLQQIGNTHPLLSLQKSPSNLKLALK